jgi:hypothetical protein
MVILAVHPHLCRRRDLRHALKPGHAILSVPRIAQSPITGKVPVQVINAAPVQRSSADFSNLLTGRIRTGFQAAAGLRLRASWAGVWSLTVCSFVMFMWGLDDLQSPTLRYGHYCPVIEGMKVGSIL